MTRQYLGHVTLRHHVTIYCTSSDPRIQEDGPLTSQYPTVAEENAAKAEKLPAFVGFSLNHLRDEVAEALAHFGRMEIFEEYTKHDITHVNGLLRIYDWLIPKETQEVMSVADWLIIVISSYLHDFGLLVTRTEFENRHLTKFAKYRSELNESYAGSAQLLDYLDSLESEERREKFLYQEFVRKHHASRIRAWLTGKSEDDLGFDPTVTGKLSSILATVDRTFLADLALVCESHHLDDIYDTRKYPISRPYGASAEETANVQYAAIVLRAADLMHITQDRSPATAFQIVSPRNPISQIEWSKQGAVRAVRSRPGFNEDSEVDLNAPRDTIEVHATFTDSDGFFGLTAYLQYASKEIAECHKWAATSAKRHGAIHHFPWRKVDSSHVEADGFEANPFEFKVDQHKILELLTGHTLYNDTSVVVRELVQNAIDAVRLEEFLALDRAYEPCVTVTWDPQENRLSVLDNGTGMTQEVIESNFLRVGSSRYSDPQFLKEYPAYSPISRFGIGVLSAFMVADDVQVLTVSRDESEARQLTLRTVHGQYLIKLLEKTDPEVPNAIKQHGTIISVNLRPGAKTIDVLQTLKKWIVVPRCNVRYVERRPDSDLDVEIGYKGVEEALRAEILESGPALEHTGRLSDASGDEIQIRTSSRDGVTVAYAVRWNKWFDEWEFLVAPRHEQTLRRQREVHLGTCIEGIRVTTQSAGYRTNSIWSIADARGKRAPRTNVARDAIEATSEYNQFLESVYRAYIQHIAGELERMSTTGLSSLTRAAREVDFLARGLVGRGNFPSASSRELFFQILEEVPAVLIETAGERKALSIQQLNAYDELMSVDSQVMRHMEFVLDALPGSITISKILSEHGKSTYDADSTALLCGQTYGGPIVDLFRKNWHIVKISADVEKREVLATWAPSRSSGTWINFDSSAFDGVNPVSFELMTELSSASDQKRLYAPVRPQAIEVSGLDDYNVIAILGLRLLLPNNPLLEIRSIEDEDPDDYRLAWLAAWIASAYLSQDRDYRQRDYRQYDDGEFAERIVRLIESDQDLSFVDISSLRAVLETYTQKIFDIGRWERGFSWL